MDHDTDKIDEYTLALLYLGTHNRQEGFGARAWKGFDWDTMEEGDVGSNATYPLPLFLTKRMGPGLGI